MKKKMIDYIHPVITHPGVILAVGSFIALILLALDKG